MWYYFYSDENHHRELDSLSRIWKVSKDTNYYRIAFAWFAPSPMWSYQNDLSFEIMQTLERL